MPRTRIVYWGSPGIAAGFLRHLVSEHSADFDVTACVTQTEKMIQRQGKTSARSAVHEAALELGIPVFTPQSVKKEAELLLQELAKYEFDLFVVLAYGKILPQQVIEAPRLRSVNFHGSLLPLLRGASPIEHSLLHGFNETGWTLQRIVPALDAGGIVAQSVVHIAEQETTGSLYDKMTADLLAHGASMLKAYISGSAAVRPQDEAQATHCGKISAADGKLDFSDGYAAIRNRYRAFTPRPGVFALFRGKKVKLAFDLASQPVQTALPAGTLLRSEPAMLHVACGDGMALPIAQITPEGKRPMAVADFLNGYRPGKTETLT